MEYREASNSQKNEVTAGSVGKIQPKDFCKSTPPA